MMMMMMRASLLASLLLSSVLFLSGTLETEKLDKAFALDYSRNDFPKDFVFGAGSSAFQIEGAVAEDGRTPSIWDTFTHKGLMLDKSNADVASDGYHKYKEDVKLMGDMGLEAYRFSISWSRLIPNGRGEINPKGLQYYNNLINELVKCGIEIHITIFHIDLPQALQDEYGGWLSPKIVDDFTAYADVCFREFGDRVSHWTTMVEPNVIAMAAYDSGAFPPNRCSYPFGYFNCSAGNSTVEPYIAVHNALLTHASVVELYRDKYQAAQKGVIGINVYTFWCYPFTNSDADIEAAQRARDFYYGWIIDPVVFGDYPEVMKKNAGSRIPAFTKSQSELVKGSADFIGINHYTSVWISDDSNVTNTGLRDFNADVFAAFRNSPNDTSTGAFLPIELANDPLGLQHILEYFKENYGNIPIYVQENGYGQNANETLNDADRINYLNGYITSTLDALRNGCNVKGYFVWAFMDVFEFLAGYQSRYGLYHVDFKNDSRPRQPKLSARWYSNFMKGENGIAMEKASLYDAYYVQQ